MWSIEYAEEAKLYFIDNRDLVFDLLVQIEELKFAEDGYPPGNWIELETDVILWSVLNHLVIFQRRETDHHLRIAVVKPVL